MPTLKILLDPGHAGKYNRAPLVPAYYESDMTWKLAQLLIKAFSAYKDVQVDLTRPDQDTDVEVYDRGLKAKGYDVFISLHSNAVGNSKTIQAGDKNERTDRVDVYVPLDKRNGSHELGKVIADAVAELMDVSYGQIKTREYPDKPGVEYYGVLRGAQKVGCPMYMLIEHSFHTNIAAATWLLDDKHLEMLAILEADAIAQWYDLEEVTVPGDVNGNGEIDPQDYLLTKRIFFGTYDADEDEFERADVDGDGKVTAMDYLLIKRAYFGTIDLDKLQPTNSSTDTDKKPTTDPVEPSQPSFKEGDKVKCNEGVTKFSNGKTMASWVPKSVLYVRGVEKEGTVLLVSTEPVKNVYTGRVYAKDVHKI